jgi:Domain of unknown function (DUF4430)
MSRHARQGNRSSRLRRGPLPRRGVVRAALGLVAPLTVLVTAGCGLGAGPAPTAVNLTVTRDFGETVVRSFPAPQVKGQETVMSLLMRNATVSTRYGGGFVQSIDGLSGGQEAGQPVDWFYYVNGVEASKGAADTNVHPGDHVWWDRHDWSQTDRIPAVVGSFPEPFLNGTGGKRLPLRVECAVVAGYACRTVTERLRALGAPAAIAALGGGGGESQTLRVAVAPWADIEDDPQVQGIERGPSSSGVFARFSANGSTLTLLDENGRSVRTLSAGAGLIAATSIGENAPVWVITGTDAQGVESAARAFDNATLDNRFAVAVSPAGTVALPEASP